MWGRPHLPRHESPDCVLEGPPQLGAARKQPSKDACVAAVCTERTPVAAHELEGSLHRRHQREQKVDRRAQDAMAPHARHGLPEAC